MAEELRRRRLCRLCAEPREALIGIYEAEGQRLAIDAKIAKCLRIQVLENDSLPLFVCNDCCALLNQCNEFYEKSNEAQSSLRHLLTDSKANEELESDAPVQENLEERNIKGENGEDDGTDDVNEANFDLDNSSVVKAESQDYSEEEKSKSSSKKGAPRQNNKKKVKQKTDSDKKGESEFIFVESEQKQGTTASNNESDGKANVKIPENYMTGTESDMEMIVLSGKKSNTEQSSKTNKKKGDKLERYPWLCTDCNDKLPSLETLEEHHEKIHNQKAKYMCVQCCKVYEKYYGFLTHVKRHKNKTKFSCDECGKTFIHKKVLDTHKAIHSEARPHVCQTCGKSFRQQSALYIHSRCHLPENMKNRFPCDQCDKRFSTKPNLVTHKRIHSGVRNFTCDQCGKSFIQKGNLEAHFLTHSTDKPYNCSHCSKAFKTPLQLKKHETVHTGAKPHQCAVCGRTFREKGTLREHHRIHTGAMPFECEFCGKCFRFKGILTTHRRQHTGERPYSCVECQHHFTNWPNYNKHMKRRHGINTSHTKHLQQPSQQQQQEAQQNLRNLQDQQQQQTIQPQPQRQPPPLQPALQIQSVNSATLRHPIAPTHVTTTTVQVIQTVPHVTVTQQPIVLQTLTNAPVTAIQTFAEGAEGRVITASPLNQEHEHLQVQPSQPQLQPVVAGFRGERAYFNAIGAPLTTFLQPNVPYNLYNISNVPEADLIHHR